MKEQERETEKLKKEYKWKREHLDKDWSMQKWIITPGTMRPSGNDSNRLCELAHDTTKKQKAPRENMKRNTRNYNQTTKPNREWWEKKKEHQYIFIVVYANFESMFGSVRFSLVVPFFLTVRWNKATRTKLFDRKCLNDIWI